MSIYVMEVLSNIGENSLCRKNGQLSHEIELSRIEKYSPLLITSLPLSSEYVIETGVVEFDSGTIFLNQKVVQLKIGMYKFLKGWIHVSR